MTDLLASHTPEPLNTPNTVYINNKTITSNAHFKLIDIDLSNMYILFAAKLHKHIPNDYLLLFFFKSLVELASSTVTSHKEYNARSTLLEDSATELEQHFLSQYFDEPYPPIYDIMNENSDLISVVYEYWRVTALTQQLAPYHWEVSSSYGTLEDGAEIDIRLYCLVE